ncbi:MAG: oxygen-dependent coproporphyrinogen oxidase [Bacteroidota bacterium]
MLTKEQIAAWFQGLQDRICSALEELDAKGKFKEDAWRREGGGGGRSRIIEGQIIEKGGVNFSAVHGSLPEKIASALGLPASNFFATGVSIVLHPASPMLPIIHMNVRYFETNAAASHPSSLIPHPSFWVGGGIDLTPHYVVDEDARFFHRQLKAACDRHHPAFYQEFKQWADDYFYLKHRQETRGVGGIFFDRLDQSRGLNKEQLFAFVQDVGEAFAPAYVHLALKNKDLPFGEREKTWQALRRGRYVEFNLLWDKGTKFGLDTEGRTESILMSMPPLAQWVYNYQPEPYSEEARTLEQLKKGIDWV